MKIRKVLIVPVLALALAGCGVAQWIKVAQQILPVLLPMITNLVTVVSLLEGKTIPAADVNTISQTANEVSADLNLAGQLVNQYESSPSATTVQKINSLLLDVNAHLNALLPALHISDPATVQKVTAITMLIGSEVSSFEQILPLAASAQARAPSPLAVPLTARQLKKQFDAIVLQPTANAQVNAAFAQAALK